MENLSFLIVDDNSHMVSILKVLLRAFGVRQIEECYDSTRACDAFQAARPDIVALSGSLSPLTSLELVRRFRDFENSPDPFVPIILVNTHADSARLKKARDAGVTEIVRKPVNATDLFRSIEAIINRPRPFINVAGYFGPCRRRGDEPFEGADRRQTSALRAAEGLAAFTPFPLPAGLGHGQRGASASVSSLLRTSPFARAARLREPIAAE